MLRMSFWKQLPPNPAQRGCCAGKWCQTYRQRPAGTWARCASRGRWRATPAPVSQRAPCSKRTSVTSAPVASQMALMELMLEMRWARNAFAACMRETGLSAVRADQLRELGRPRVGCDDALARHLSRSGREGTRCLPSAPNERKSTPGSRWQPFRPQTARRLARHGHLRLARQQSNR